jgi:uncharacterized damage-inducible protein DinB
VKEMLQQYAAYNTWATQKLVEALQPVPSDLLEKEITGSFSSIHLLLLHIWDAESIWWQRLKLQEVITAPSMNFKGNAKDVAAALMHQDRLWENWVMNANDSALSHVFFYRNSKKEQFKQPVFQVLLHLFNHATYHRGQLVHAMRQIGMEKIPATDFIVWSRTKK